MINSRYVLTASHCVNGKDLKAWKLISVRIGEWDVSTDIDCVETLCNPNPPVDISIEAKIPHEDFNPQSLNQHNDIALLRLSMPAPFNSHIRPICLPVASQLQDYDLTSKTMSVAGWGRTETASASKVKLKVNVDGISNVKCKEIYKTKNREIAETQVCAGGKEGIDSWYVADLLDLFSLFVAHFQ